MYRESTTGHKTVKKHCYYGHFLNSTKSFIWSSMHNHNDASLEMWLT